MNSLHDKDEGEKEGAENASNNKTTVKKKKKIPLTKKVEVDQIKTQSKTDNKTTHKEVRCNLLYKIDMSFLDSVAVVFVIYNWKI